MNLTSLDRRDWVPFFEKSGFPAETVFSMPTSEFYQIASTLIKSGAIPPAIKTDKKLDKKTCIAIQCAIIQLHWEMIQKNANEREKLRIERKKKATSAKTEKDIQDIEYEKLLQQHMIDEENKEKEITQAQRNKEEEEQRKEEVRKKIIDEFNALGDEPVDGFQIAVQMPSGKRIVRKFKAENMGINVYQWINYQEEMFDQNGDPIDYELQQVMVKIEKDKTLQEQNIKKRTLLTVITYTE